MSSRRGNIRTSRAIRDESEDKPQAEEILKESLESIKLKQKLRKRNVGLDVAAFLSEEKEDDSSHQLAPELMESYVAAKAVVEGDEDPHMEKFIEKEVAARLGKKGPDEVEEEPHELRRRLQEEELYAIPDELKSTLNTEVSLPGLITGITEVPLSLEARLRNIEETEEMKRRMLAKSSRRAGVRGTEEEEEARKRKMNQGPELRRGMFVATFGRQQKRSATPVDEEQLRYIRAPAASNPTKK